MGVKTRRRWGLGARWAAPGVALAAGVALVVGALVAGSEDVGAVELPQAITGTAVLNGAAAPDSAVITVEIGGEQCLTSPPIVHPQGGTYFLAIEHGFVGPCQNSGKTRFFINGLLGAERTLTSITATVNLNAIDSSPTSAPTSSATPSATQTSVPSSTPMASASPAGPTLSPTPTSSTTATRTPTPQTATPGPAGQNRVSIPGIARD